MSLPHRLNRIVSHLRAVGTASPNNLSKPVSFNMRVDGTLLRGILFEPDGCHSGNKVPAIIMAHGFSATYKMGLIPFAETFRHAGYVVLMYDHKSFGASEGEPRGLVDWFRDVDEYRDAIDFVSQLEFVDPERIAIWGMSFSGGTVLSVGAVDDRVKAVISNLPAGIDAVPNSADPAEFEAVRRVILDRTYIDAEKRVIGPMTVASTDPEVVKQGKAWFGGVLKFVPGIDGTNLVKWFLKRGLQPGSGWQNSAAMVARKTGVKQSSDIPVHFLHSAVLITASREDEIIPFDACEKAFKCIPSKNKEFYELSGGHLDSLINDDPNPGQHSRAFHDLARAQLAFLKRVLQ